MKKYSLNKIISTVILLGLSMSMVEAQAPKKIALMIYDKLGYKTSIPKFVDADKLNLESMQKVANSYRLNHDTPNAEMWYSQVIESSSDPIDFLYYAQALQSNGKYDEAKSYYMKYDEMLGGESKDRRGALLSTAVDRMNQFRHTDVQIRNVKELNTSKLDFSPTYYQNGLVYVSSRGAQSWTEAFKDIWIDDNFMALFKSEFNDDGSLTESELFSTNLTTKFHEGPVSFNRSGDRIFFTRNDFNKGKRRNSSKGIMKLQIYTSSRTGEDWSTPEALPFNTQEHEEAHPTISADGKWLFFASDREGGYGGMDIYASQFKEGQWSAAHNLGDQVNTPGNDAFPYIHDDGTLYFSSDGWGGLGGLDIFMAKQDANYMWQQAENIGTPFNSKKDDFGMIMNVLGTEGYFTSAREGGQGQDDIYSFKMYDSNVMKAVICTYDMETNERIENVSVKMMPTDGMGMDHTLKLIETDVTDEYILKFRGDGMSGSEKQYMTDANGQFNVQLQKEMKYKVVATHGGYVMAEQMMTMEEMQMKGNTLEYCIPMERMNCMNLTGVVKNKKYGKEIPAADVTMVNKCTGEEVMVKSDSKGRFDFSCIPCDCEFYFKGEKKYFTEGTNTASTMKVDCGNGGTLKTDVLLELTPVDPSMVNTPMVNPPVPTTVPSTPRTTTAVSPGLSTGAVIELPHVYYDFDKFYIRDDAKMQLDKVVRLMQQYPSLDIELGSHTDARGTESYNRNLSQNRANSAVQYIISRGIASSRLVAKGYGESQLKNQCTNFNKDCSEEEHQVNRRTEIRVLRFNNPNVGVKYLENGPSKIDRADPSRSWIWN